MAELDWGEARRYLGLHKPGGTTDAALEDQLRACGEELVRTARPKAVWRRFPLALGEKSALLAGMELESAHLRRHLEGCAGVYLFAATLGVEVDRLIHRAGVTDVSRAVMFQACAASLLEAYCDERCGALAREAAGEGLFLRPRFSPGYGDLDLSCQRALLAALDAPKRIGLTATETMMLSPTKSVTAVVGVGPEGRGCYAGGCACCGKRDCAFRREAGSPPSKETDE